MLSSLYFGPSRLTLSRTWDTAGLLARDLQACRDIAAEWLDPSALVENSGVSTCNHRGHLAARLLTLSVLLQPVSSIVWPTDFWSIIDPGQVALAQGFVKTLNAVLSIDSRDVSFWESWAQNPPKEAENLSLQEYIVGVGASDSHSNYAASVRLTTL